MKKLSKNSLFWFRYFCIVGEGLSAFIGGIGLVLNNTLGGVGLFLGGVFVVLLFGSFKQDD